MLAIAGSMFSILLMPFFYGEIPVTLALMVFLVAVLIAAGIFTRWFSHLIAKAVVWDVVFLAISGLVFLSILSLVIPLETVHGSEIIIICGAYIVAWLAGLATPGAPAGVGIREIVLFLFLKSVVNEADLLTAIVFGRIVTIGGDVLFYLVALATKTRTA